MTSGEITSEKLRPDLEQCLWTDENGHSRFEHRLHKDFIYEQNPEQSYFLINRAIECAEAESKEAFDSGAWHAYIFTHTRAFRLPAFCDTLMFLSNKEYWELLASVWTDSENIWQYKESWITLLSSPRRQPGRSALRTLPKQVTVYRGTSAPDGMGSGLSWTLDRDVALWFAKRFARSGRTAKLLSANVNRKDIILSTELPYFGREKDEVVTLTPAGITEETITT